MVPQQTSYNQLATMRMQMYKRTKIQKNVDATHQFGNTKIEWPYNDYFG